jgi:glycolate oxidase
VKKYDLRDYWNFVDWYAPQYNENTTVTKILDYEHEISRNDPQIGDIYKIKNSSNGNWKLVVVKENSIELVGQQNATLQFNSKLYDNLAVGFGMESQSIEIVPYAKDAAIAVNKVLLSGVLPTGLELMEVSGVEISAKATQTSFPIPPNVQFYLMVILDGMNYDLLMTDAENIYPILEEAGAFDVLMPNNAEMAENWWKVRRSIGETVKQQSIYKEEDTVVPRASLPDLLTGVKEIGEKYNFRTVCYGHAGDGNLHVNILKDQLADEVWENEIPKGIVEIFELCKKLGRTISGDHGVGLVQKPYLDVVFNSTHWMLMKGIKTLFDPQNILNPGKWIESTLPM